MAHDYQADILAVSRIEAVPTILDIVCRTTGMGFAAVARVTEDRWIACSVKDEIAFGLKPGGELNIETTICHQIRQNRQAVVINNVAEDPDYCGHQTPALYGFQSYISMPIVLPNGEFFGTLCAIDPRPARLKTPEVIGMFKLFAELIAFHLNALEQVATRDARHSEDRKQIAVSEARHIKDREQIATGEARLLDEQHTSKLREEFIAVLGHDLRNPLGAIRVGADLLRKTPLNDKASHLVTIIQSSADRMSRLIDDVLDFARGRLGSGLTLEHTSDEPLEPVLRQVIGELQARYPKQVIQAEVTLHHPVSCDHTRVAQLLSNLLGNALTYGATDKPILVRAITGEATFELSVTNAGDPIAPAALERLFQPFSRGAVRASQQGLGLGLFIASEVAKAHGGTLEVASTPEQTCFTFRMPRI